MADEAQIPIGAAVFNARGELQQPQHFRQWVFLGAPLTPNGLNNGQAAFPEIHHVYINPDAYAVYQQTGQFPDGTVIAKELVLLQEPDYKDGSKNAPSGRGFFAGAFHGMDVMVKDSSRFSTTNSWGFFNFGHHAPPYEPSAKAAPAESCASCHTANAHRDMVFANFYPILNF
ncbi:MAG: cytochrome P460 family protein [Halioglobus sp.]